MSFNHYYVYVAYPSSLTPLQPGQEVFADERQILLSRTPSTVVSTVDGSVRQTKKLNEYSVRCSVTVND